VNKFRGDAHTNGRPRSVEESPAIPTGGAPALSHAGDIAALNM